jgi:hypothetical protein
MRRPPHYAAHSHLPLQRADTMAMVGDRLVLEVQARAVPPWCAAAPRAGLVCHAMGWAPCLWHTRMEAGKWAAAVVRRFSVAMLPACLCRSRIDHNLIRFHRNGWSSHITEHFRPLILAEDTQQLGIPVEARLSGTDDVFTVSGHRLLTEHCDASCRPAARPALRPQGMCKGVLAEEDGRQLCIHGVPSNLVQVVPGHPTTHNKLLSVCNELSFNKVRVQCSPGVHRLRLMLQLPRTDGRD